MLKFMRRHARGFLIKALFTLIIVVFVFWGIGSFRSRERVIARVDGRPITLLEYEENYRRLFGLLAQRGVGEQEIKEKALQDLINKYMLISAAERLGINVSEEELLVHISSMDAFKHEGTLSRGRLITVLKRRNIDPKAFEEKERLNVLASKMADIVKDGVLLSEEEVWLEYVKEKGRVELGYMVFDPEELLSRISVDEREIEEIYEREKDRLKEENLLRLKYVVFDEGRRVKEDEVYMDLLKETDLEAYARRKGLSFYDSGLIQEKEARERFKDFQIEALLRDLRKGEISLPIRKGSSFYIFQLFDFKEGAPLRREEALKILRERVKRERATVLARAQAEEALEKGRFFLKKKTGVLPRTSRRIDGIGEIPEGARGIFQLTEKEPIFKKPVAIAGRYYIFRYEREEPPDRDMWEKERTLFGEYILEKKREEALRSFLESLRSRLKVEVEREYL